MLDPSTATRACASTSCWSNSSPDVTVLFVAVNHDGTVPVTVTVELVAPLATVADVDCTGETLSTSGAMSLSANASATATVRLWLFARARHPARRARSWPRR